jgi:hypothetical protein
VVICRALVRRYQHHRGGRGQGLAAAAERRWYRRAATPARWWPDGSGTRCRSSTRINAVRALMWPTPPSTCRGCAVLQQQRPNGPTCCFLLRASLPEAAAPSAATATITPVAPRCRNARPVFSLEVVTAQGDIWHGLSGLRRTTPATTSAICSLQRRHVGATHRRHACLLTRSRWSA